ncbi:cytochrome c oxidase subunit 3 [Mesorhizobium sp. M1312]|uniref:cytochrome c oxidase subunit 3 n=1 Tax=unclassified Mesorhizobium TaxID=325217 RepID=UPI003336B8F2
MSKTVTEVGGTDGRWPVATAVSLFLLACAGLALFHPSLFGTLAGSIAALGPLVIAVGLLPLFIALTAWSRATSGERANGPQNTFGPRIAIIALIASEVAFFAALFAVYLRYAIYPEIAGFSSWPPTPMRPDDPWGGPLLNTVILVASGVCVAAAHDWLLKERWQLSAIGLTVAIALGGVFVGLQLREFSLASVGFRDGVYPSIFFLTTGFHGLHVVIGILLLSIAAYRVIRARSAGGAGFITTAASWYWHFVDAVWLVLFAVFYAWAS